MKDSRAAKKESVKEFDDYYDLDDTVPVPVLSNSDFRFGTVANDEYANPVASAEKVDRLIEAAESIVMQLGALLETISVDNSGEAANDSDRNSKEPASAPGKPTSELSTSADVLTSEAKAAVTPKSATKKKTVRKKAKTRKKASSRKKVAKKSKVRKKAAATSKTVAARKTGASKSKTPRKRPVAKIADADE